MAKRKRRRKKGYVFTAARRRALKKAQAANRAKGRGHSRRRTTKSRHRRVRRVLVLTQNPEGRWTAAEASRAGHTLVGYRDHPSRGLPKAGKKKGRKKGRKKSRR